MRIYALTSWLALTVVAGGCKTGGSSIKEDASASPQLYCNFVSPSGHHESLQVWLTIGDGSQLRDVRQAYTRQVGEAATSTPTANAAAASVATITKNKSRRLRTLNKGFVYIDFSQTDCFDLAAGGDTSSQSYLCLGKSPDSSGHRPALWASNQTSVKYATDLTVLKTSCGRP